MSATAIAASSAAISSVAAAQAAQAKREACEAIVTVFDSKEVTVESAKSYADCIQYLYPDPMDSGETVILKIFIALIFAGFVYGGVTNNFGFVNTFTDRFMSALLGGCIVAGGGLLLFLAVGGIQFLFS